MKVKNFWWWYLHALNYILSKFKDFILLNFYYEFKWRKKNKHNYTHIWMIFDLSHVEVWNYSTWILNIMINSKKSFVKIWSFCCIWRDVLFMALGNHPTNWFLTEWITFYYTPDYHFKLNNIHYTPPHLREEDKNIIKNKVNEKAESTCHWPIIIDDDVWIWMWVKIMSWVHIWQWACIWAWSVVTKNVPPYAIVWWVPAKVIKYRFSEDKIKQLLKIDFSNITIEDLSEVYEETIKEDFDIQKIQNSLTKK